jgi:hypothetical protein
MHSEATSLKPRYGHIMTMFGLFVSLLTLTFNGVNAPHTIAFGTSEIANLSNQYRSAVGLPTLVTNSSLTASAQAKADHLAANNYFAHDTPDGTSPWYFFDEAGYSYLSAGENLALSNQSASSVVDGWYNSPGHRANMLSSSFVEVGYGISFVPTFTYEETKYSNVYLVAAHYAVPQLSVATTTPGTGSTTPTPVAEIEKPKDESTSGTIAVASKDQPRLSTKLGYVGLGMGIILVIVGSAIEFRRIRRHLPLIPHLR